MKKLDDDQAKSNLKKLSPLSGLRHRNPPPLRPAPQLQPAPGAVEDGRGHPGRASSPGLLGALGLAVTVLGTLAAPQAPASLVVELDQTDPVLDEVTSLSLELGGLLSLRGADASLSLQINPLAVAALVLAWRAPALLGRLLRGRPLREALDGEPLSPEALRPAIDLSRDEGVDPALAPTAVRQRVVEYLAQLGVVEANEVADRIESRVAQAMRGRIRPDVFVSYAHADGDALPLAIHAALGAASRVVFWDSQAFIGGAPWRPLLLDMLRRSRLFVLLVGAAFERSHWQEQEMIAAIDCQHSGKGAPQLLPVCIDGAELPFGLLGRHCLHYRSGEPPAPLIAELRRALEAAAGW
ncbi:MAG: toll/interleukin-1 receptor domain-containing protein [Rhodocyclaceae bacterium]|nr:toll/interleukin-1 receptor domain-containing protein [Rhodocyclaceae bacterium]